MKTMTDPVGTACRHACRHADCCMDRGDPLPGVVARAWWPDGSEYAPRVPASAVAAIAEGDDLPLGEAPPLGEASQDDTAGCEAT